MESIKNHNPEHISSFFHRWMHCSLIGRGADMVPNYLDSLSRAYLKSLSSKQQKSIEDDSYSIKRNKLITLGFKKIEMEYIEFLKIFYEMSEKLYDIKEIRPLPVEIKLISNTWLENISKSIAEQFKLAHQPGIEETITLKKEKYDKLLQVRTCMLLLGRSPHQLPFNPSAYELFIAYREFLEAGLCKRVNLTFNILMLNKSEPSSYQKIHSPKVLIIKKEEILHYNKWLTDQIQKYLKKLDSKLEDLFTPYISFKNMGLLFGLTQNYLREQRYTKNSKNIISKSVLEEMKVSLSQKINDFIIKNPSLREILEHVNLDLLQIIENYENVLKPLPKPHYQMFKHHPEFNRNYFAEIITPEQAYWLGFLFADGYIALEHKKSGDYFRMGIGLSEKEKDLLNKFCKAIGLNPKFISTSMEYCSYTDKRTPIVRIRWGDQQMAMNLMDLGLNYEFNKMKGRRAKIPKLPLLKNKKLMLSFLLGYYDGDGSLGLTTFRNLPRVLPSIISSDYTFLLEIKVYFNIKYKIYNHSYEKYDFKQKKVVKTEGYKLLLGIDLFREMLISFRDSLKRKRVSIDFLDNQSTTSQRLWLRKILRKDKLEQMAQFLSAHKIGKLLGIDHRTLISFADEDYGFKFESGGYYASINNSIRWHGNDSPYYENMVKWKNYLKKLGKFLIE